MIRLNRNIYLAILLCFFLPFAKGCDFDLSLAEEMLTSEIRSTDSVQALQGSQDTAASINEEPEPAGKIEKNFFRDVLSGLIMPGGDYSGFYLVIVGTLSLKGWLSLVPAFLILVFLIFLSVTQKPIGMKSIMYLNLAFTLFMIIFLAFYFKDLMYGFWITLILSFINLAISFKARKDKVDEA